jgi:hypothetical protein
MPSIDVNTINFEPARKSRPTAAKLQAIADGSTGDPAKSGGAPDRGSYRRGRQRRRQSVAVGRRAESAATLPTQQFNVPVKT